MVLVGRRIRRAGRNLLDWRLRAVLRKSGIPDLPETRRMLRLAWWDGFTGGAFSGRETAARDEALAAMMRYYRGREYVKMRRDLI